MKYNFFPEVNIEASEEIFTDYIAIQKELKQKIKEENLKIIIIENYPAVDETEILTELVLPLEADKVIHADTIFLDSEIVEEKIKDYITNDRVFGRMSHHRFEQFIDPTKHQQIKKEIEQLIHDDGVVVVYGVAASLVYKADLLVYADLSRWEIQTRYRSGKFSNWLTNNAGLDPLRMIKRGYFFEWQIADRQKRAIFSDIDYLLDTHQKNRPVMVTEVQYSKGLEEVIKQPFTLVPFFDPGVWGGNWMQETFDFRKDEINLAWSFNGVPEENSILLNFSGVRMEIPGNNIVFFHGEELLGERVFGRFGHEFPIRFNFLDTIKGQNLSLQVHPKIGYAQETFGAHYTQDESYYILHAEENAKIYLGVKNGVKKGDLMPALKRAADGEEVFDDEKYIYQQVVKKHDHYSIPSGTIHSSGANSVVLEISSTPNRYTFKLWDWERVDLDGLPRPVHLNHGEPNIDISRDENWVKKELINSFKVIDQGDGWQEERTGLHESEFIETRRHTFSVPVIHENHGSVNVLNLVEGEEVVVECPNQTFQPFKVHYAQTFIIPETIKKYKISPTGKSQGKIIKTIKAFVR